MVELGLALQLRAARLRETRKLQAVMPDRIIGDVRWALGAGEGEEALQVAIVVLNRFRGAALLHLEVLEELLLQLAQVHYGIVPLQCRTMKQVEKIILLGYNTVVLSRGSSVVERVPEEHGVASSILAPGTRHE